MSDLIAIHQSEGPAARYENGGHSRMPEVEIMQFRLLCSVLF